MLYPGFLHLYCHLLLSEYMSLDYYHSKCFKHIRNCCDIVHFYEVHAYYKTLQI